MAKINPTDYSYHVINIGDDTEDAYEAIIPNFPNLHVYGDNPKELNDGVIATIEFELEELEKKGKIPPPPDKKSDFNGKISLPVAFFRDGNDIHAIGSDWRFFWRTRKAFKKHKNGWGSFSSGRWESDPRLRLGKPA